MLAIQNTEYTQFLKQLSKQLQPKAIVIFTAHWESPILTISSRDDIYDTIYDFGGFPKELYTIKYPAKGSSIIAKRLKELFMSQGFDVRLDNNRGLDHGSWTLLSRMYPKANIPVVQVSVNPDLPLSAQYEIGKCLRNIGDEGILVIGSGVTVHNFETLNWNQIKAEDWAIEFDNWLIEKMAKENLKELFELEKVMPFGKRAVPSREHFAPAMIAMGAGNGKEIVSVLYQGYEFGTLSYLSLKF